MKLALRGVCEPTQHILIQRKYEGGYKEKYEAAITLQASEARLQK